MWKKIWHLIQNVNLDSFLHPENKNLHMCTVAVLWVWHLTSSEMPLALSTQMFHISWVDDCVCSIPISWSPRLKVAFLLFFLCLWQPALILNIRTQQGNNSSLILQNPNYWEFRGRSHLKEMQSVENMVLWGMEEECERWWRRKIRIMTKSELPHTTGGGSFILWLLPMHWFCRKLKNHKCYWK